MFDLKLLKILSIKFKIIYKLSGLKYIVWIRVYPQNLQPISQLICQTVIIYSKNNIKLSQSFTIIIMKFGMLVTYYSYGFKGIMIWCKFFSF